MVSLNALLIVLSGAILAQANPVAQRPSCCAADRCFAAASLPASLTPGISSFCQKYITKTRGTVTRTATTIRTVTTTTTSTRAAPPPFILTTAVTVTSTVSPATPSVVTVTTTGTTTFTSATPCVVTSSTTFPTQINYVSRGAGLSRRAAAPSIPSVLTAGCSTASLPQKVSSACSCFLTSKTVTVTRTSTRTATATATGPIIDPSLTTTSRTVTATVTLPTPAIPTVTVPATSTSTVETCTSTSTSYIYGGAFSCGIPSPSVVASGTVTCDSVAPPGETNARFRIEGTSEGTIFEDCIISGPRNITTPSGGTHRCDGTNNNANRSPGATLTTEIDSAGRQEGFPFDGSYDNRFQDFFITSISRTTQSGNQYWGVLRDRVFSSRGGCQEPAVNGVEGLWAFDAFRPNLAFLRLDPGYAVVEAGTASIALTVTGTNPNEGSASPISGADVGGVTSGADGSVTLPVPTEPGCYQYKATRSDSVRSNAFYLTVLPPSDD